MDFKFRLLIAIAIVISIAKSSTSQKKVVCYHTNWSQYRPDGGKFYPENIDANLCTHVIYSFAKVSGTTLQPYEWNDESTGWSKGMYERTMDLKNKNPNLKILLAVGGWTHGSGPFSTMAQSAESRKSFVANSLDFIKKHKFDGLDLDWEYPGSREGSQPSDKQRFTDLVRELKAEYSKHGLLLTAAVAAGKATIDKGYEIAEISKDLDFINLMSYDLHGAWETFTGHNAPLYKRSDERDLQAELNVDFAAQYWLSKGTPREKLILGLGTYGRAFRLSNPSKTSLGSPASGAASAGTFTREGGFLSYYEVCQKLSSGWKREWNEEQKVPYAYKDSEWVGYDDLESLAAKVDYIKANNLGGAMFWALDLDDFDGKFCGQGKYPLINAVKRQLMDGVSPLPTSFATTTKSETSPKTSEQEPKDTSEPKTTTPRASTTTVEGQCYKGDGFYADKSSGCKKYYQCVYTGSIHATVNYYECAEGLLFDAKTETCNWPNAVTCEQY